MQFGCSETGNQWLGTKAMQVDIWTVCFPYQGKTGDRMQYLPFDEEYYTCIIITIDNPELLYQEICRR